MLLLGDSSATLDNVANPNKAQGTELERHVRDTAKSLSILAMRMEEGGSKDANDVWLCTPPNEDTLTALVWKRYIGKKSDGRRTTQTVVVISEEDWWKIVDKLGYDVSWLIECKATQQLSVTATLKKAQDKLRRYLQNKPA